MRSPAFAAAGLFGKLAANCAIRLVEFMTQSDDPFVACNRVAKRTADSGPRCFPCGGLSSPMRALAYRILWATNRSRRRRAERRLSKQQNVGPSVDCAVPAEHILAPSTGDCFRTHLLLG